MTIQLHPDRPSFPPAEAIECVPIREAIERYQGARDAEAAAYRDLTELQNTRDRAVEQDRRAYADKLAKNARAADPGQPATEAHDAQTDAAERTYRARQLVREDAYGVLCETIDAHTDEWREQVAAQRDGAYAAYVAALGALAQRHAELCRAIGLSRYVGERSTGYASYNGETGGTVPMRHSADHELDVSGAIDALRRFGEPREPVIPTYLGSDGERHPIKPGTGRLRSISGPAAVRLSESA